MPRKTSDDPKEIERVKNEAHVRPRFPAEWKRDGKYTGANPERTNTLLARESWEFVRFINPGDLRVAAKTCGSSGCHEVESKNVARSMMTHGAMLWGAALYNNGGFPLKDARFGESYSENGAPQTLIQNAASPRSKSGARKGLLEFLDPMPRWEISQPGNVLRVFERGGKRRLEVGLPDREEEPGKPDKGLSPRGFGTAQRTDPVFLGLQKTRLLDPTLNFLGTNDHPGDYRSSGCTACHVIYANDRDPSHSAFYQRGGKPGPFANRRREHSEKRIGPSDQASVHQPDSDVAVHGLSHAPGHKHGRDLSRHDLVGQRERRRQDVSEEAAQSVAG